MNAIYQKNLEMAGDAALFRLEPPLVADGETIEFVAVSSINNMWAYETMIFPATPEGEVLDFGDLACIQELSHSDCLAELGYKAVWP